MVRSFESVDGPEHVSVIRTHVHYMCPGWISYSLNYPTFLLAHVSARFVFKYVESLTPDNEGYAVQGMFISMYVRIYSVTPYINKDLAYVAKTG